MKNELTNLFIKKVDCPKCSHNNEHGNCENCVKGKVKVITNWK